MKAYFSPSLLACAVFFGAGTGHAHDTMPGLPGVVVTGQHDHAWGSGEAASQGVIGAEQLHNRALLRPAEVLEYIPGMVVSQHSGDGKANQYFLRGMNLDHGTDFATTVNGVPINLPTHAHGHGYSDLNSLIPELVSRVEYRKGPYFASEGDFSSAGSAHIFYRTQLDQPFAAVTLGQWGHVRAVAAGSREVSNGVFLLSAVERMNNDGPWAVPEGMRKLNALFTLSGGTPRENWSTSLSAYAASWNATDQVPQRLIDAGNYQGQPFGRYDTLDPSDGAMTQRVSLSGNWRRSEKNQTTAVQWYAIQSDLDLYSNFTYSLERASDQFGQSDRRWVLGGQANRTWITERGDDLAMLNTLGVQVRQDAIRLGLFDTAQRQLQGTVRDDEVQQSMLGVYGQNEIAWRTWLRTIVGLRADHLQVHVNSRALSDNSAQASDFKLLPKMSFILGPWQQTEFFLNAGHGFHSNDARGMTVRVDPKKTSLPIDRVPGLVVSRGYELGIKTHAIDNLESALALWRLDFDAELVYVGDAGNTTAGRPSSRTGIEWRNHWTPGTHLRMDVNLAWTQPRYVDQDPAGDQVVNAPQQVANMSLALRNWGNWSGALGVRYIGSAPLNKSNSVRSAPSMTANLRVARKLSPDISLTLDVLNLTDRINNDISYAYTSRVAGEATGVDGVHVHPAEPRTLRLTARVLF